MIGFSGALSNGLSGLMGVCDGTPPIPEGCFTSQGVAYTQALSNQVSNQGYNKYLQEQFELAKANAALNQGRTWGGNNEFKVQEIQAPMLRETDVPDLVDLYFSHAYQAADQAVNTPWYAGGTGKGSTYSSPAAQVNAAVSTPTAVPAAPVTVPKPIAPAAPAIAQATVPAAPPTPQPLAVDMPAGAGNRAPSLMDRINNVFGQNVLPSQAQVTPMIGTNVPVTETGGFPWLWIALAAGAVLVMKSGGGK